LGLFVHQDLHLEVTSPVSWYYSLCTLTMGRVALTQLSWAAFGPALGVDTFKEGLSHEMISKPAHTSNKNILVFIL